MNVIESGRSTALQALSIYNNIYYNTYDNTYDTRTGEVFMAINSGSEKGDVIKKYQTKEGDTGSPEVQIALLTKRLEMLSTHFQTNAHDNHSRRGMMKLISRRKGLLDFLRRENVERYRNVIAALGLRK